MITIDYDNSYRKGRLICDESILDFIRNHFSVKNKNAAFTNRTLKLRGLTKKIPERQYAIQSSGLFDYGMYHDIRNFLISEQITEIEITDNFKEISNCGLAFETVVDSLEYELRDYQTETLENCLRTGYGTVVLATGAGKSLVQASLLENWKIITGSLKCLLIVPGTGLVHQLMKDFKDYGVTFTYSGWTGEIDTKGNKILPLQDTEVVIVNTENLCSQFGNFKKLLNVDLVLVDECHKTKFGNQISKILHKIKTVNKFGFTGTLPKEKIDQWKIIGTFGPVIYEKNSKELRDENYLTNVNVVILKIIHPKSIKMGYRREVEYLEQLEERNEVIVNIGTKLKKNVLILVNHLDHGQELLNGFENSNKQVFFISGEMPVSERQHIISMMETCDDIVCIAMSSIFSTGINVKNLHYLIFTFGGKSFIRTVQSIGRGLRLHETKQLFVIFDMYDNMRYSMEHIEERKEFYIEQEIPWKEKEINLPQ